MWNSIELTNNLFRCREDADADAEVSKASEEVRGGLAGLVRASPACLLFRSNCFNRNQQSKPSDSFSNKQKETGSRTPTACQCVLLVKILC